MNVDMSDTMLVGSQLLNADPIFSTNWDPFLVGSLICLL